MLTVHHLGISQSERVVWLCEELGIDYEFKRYDRREDNRLAPDEYKALHPMGIAPVITDGDFALAESGAILEYIDRKYGDGRFSPGPDSPDFADHLFWLHFTNATITAITMMELVTAGRPDATGSDALIAERKRRAFAIVEDHLGKKPFFGGSNLTTADINMGFTLTTGRAFGAMDFADRPNIRAYLKKIGERPAYQAAMAKAEPGMEPMLT